MMHMNIAPSGCRLTVFFPDGAMVIEMLVIVRPSLQRIMVRRGCLHVKLYVGFGTNLPLTKRSISFIFIEHQVRISRSCDGRDGSARGHGGT